MDTSYYSGVKRSGSGRWVCPNDRQLALRAKLRTGWSVKSASLDSRTYSEYSRCSPTSCPSGLSSSSSNTSLPLSDAERERIIQVIQRAEALDLSEQERVGKLVERLENMKRNVTVVTSTRATNRSCGSRCIRNNRCMCCCALCGEKFTVLGAGPTLCRDCRKYVCQKCGVETSRVSRSSTTNLQANQRRGTSASINNLLSAEASSSANKQLAPPSKVFLCRICTETREMWKKSGAWFFKSLPKYVLPEKKKPRGSTRSAGWTLTGGSKSLEPSEHDSSSDEEISRKPTRTRSFLSYSLSTDPADLSSPPKPELEVEVQIEAEPKRTSADVHEEPETLGHHQTHHPPQCQLVVPSNSSSSTSPSSPISSTSPLPPSRSSSRLRDQSTSQTSIFYVRNPVGSSESVNHESSSQCESTKSSLRGRKGSSQGNSVDRAHSRGSLEFSDGSSVKHGSRRPSDSTLQYQQQREQRDRRGAGVQTRPRSKSTVGISTNGKRHRNGRENGRREELRNSRDSAEIRASIPVSSLQSGEGTGSAGNGHSRSGGSILQTEHTTDKSKYHYNKEIENQDSAQDPRSRVQRAAQLLRDHGERFEERKSFAHSDSSGRSSWKGLSRRGQISVARTTALSNEILQRIAGGSLPGGSRGESLGRGHDQRTRSDKCESELQHTPTSSPGDNQPRPRSSTNGQQRTF
ncbi:rabphilin-1 isoform X2 [Diachasma alloeum]|uniref:rabphilin-1 isoform X2 n=1 Tax=Diachasma alloeum TaxID=454923 RepID=UPI0007382DC2|nr:rabphilin-1 isoform X2 [Diachasma alloeum]